MADNLYASLDAQTQKALERERDGSESNGTNSMSASLRGSNSSLNSMPNSVISMCCYVLYAFYIFFVRFVLLYNHSVQFRSLTFFFWIIHIHSFTHFNYFVIVLHCIERRQVSGLRSPATTNPSGL